MGETTVIEGRYLGDVLAQAAALQATLEGVGDAPARVGGVLVRGSRIVLTGMGASLHALVPLELALMAAGHAPVRIDAGELVHHARGLLVPGTVVLAVSQSGRSAEIVRLLDERPAGVTMLGVCNTADAPLATRADMAVRTRAGEEATVSCKTYVATLAALDLVGVAATGGDVAGARDEWLAGVTAVQGYLDGWRLHVDGLCERLAVTKQLYFAGRGPSLAAASTAGLISKESVHFPSEGMTSAAFRHGPLEMAAREVFVLVFEGGAGTAALNRKLVEDVTRAGGSAALCGPSVTAGPFALPAAPARCLPALEILPVQLMTLALGARLGVEAGRFSHATKVTASE